MSEAGDRKRGSPPGHQNCPIPLWNHPTRRDIIPVRETEATPRAAGRAELQWLFG